MAYTWYQKLSLEVQRFYYLTLTVFYLLLLIVVMKCRNIWIQVQIQSFILWFTFDKWFTFDDVMG